MKVLVCGGRNYTDRVMVFKTLSELHASQPITRIITGDARGADALAQEWAMAPIVVDVYQADWNTHGKAAGPIRNKWMLEDSEPDLVVAFPGGAPTADMVRRARAAGVRVVTVA